MVLRALPLLYGPRGSPPCLICAIMPSLHSLFLSSAAVLRVENFVCAVFASYRMPTQTKIQGGHLMSLCFATCYFSHCWHGLRSKAGIILSIFDILLSRLELLHKLELLSGKLRLQTSANCTISLRVSLSRPIAEYVANFLACHSFVCVSCHIFCHAFGLF